MKHVLTLLLFIFISGCSVQIVDMETEPTVQKFDLTDADADGVILARDKCVDTFKGAKIDNSGCGAQRLEKIRRKLLVNFDTNSYLVKPEFYAEIEALAEFMKEFSSTNVTIEGHTSKRGSKALNQKLSQNRAQAIKDMLINDFAIEKSRITAIGYGFDKLLLEGDDEYIHAKNRRIVAEISSEREMKDMKWTIYSVDQVAE